MYSIEIGGLSAEENKSFTWFLTQMAAALHMNAHKGGWLNDDPTALFNHLDEEVEELWAAVEMLKVRLRGLTTERVATAEDVDAVVAEAADVANMAMMVADVISRCGFDNAGNGETGH